MERRQKAAASQCRSSSGTLPPFFATRSAVFVLASSGTNFIRTYAASPQCVPSRTSMFAGRHTHHIKAWSNGQGLAAAPTTGALDSICVSRYSKETCSDWAKEQDVKATLLDALREAGASGKYGGPRAIRK